MDMLIVKQIKLNVEESEKNLKNKLIKKLHLKPEDLISYEIFQKSLDARKDFNYVYSLKVNVKHEEKYLKKDDVSSYVEPDISCPKVETSIRPIIVGYGPTGIFAAIRLVEAGFKPLIFEKGSRIAKRVEDVAHFFNEGILNPESNVQFGEGGAGTFSDAKLTTRNKHPFIKYVSSVLIKYGANPEIAYESHPHIGTDVIRAIITRITDDLIAQGAEFHFDEPLSDVLINNEQIEGIETSKGQYLSPIVILATGHSAYDVFKVLDKRGVHLEQKDFSVGFRVEHPQSFINQNQYKEHLSPNLPAAEYFLTAKTSVNKGVYSFCMCPGGYVVPSSSDPETIVTNGMSYAARDNKLANSALLVQINKSDFGEELFGGFDYIHNLEKKAYAISGSYKALSQNIKDFMHNEVHDLISEPSYCLGTYNYDFNHFFDERLVTAFKEAFEHFDHLIPGFIDKGIMIGPETRSSCPLRIVRDQYFESTNIKGLYPGGEGAGYAGGIVSSALDGINISNKIIAKFTPTSH